MKVSTPDLPQTSQRKPRPKTLADYRRRYAQLKRAASKALPHLTVDTFVDWVIETRRKAWSASSWRQYRAAMLYGFGREGSAKPAIAGQIDAACSRLQQTRPWPQADHTLRTSQQKSKRMPENDCDRVRHAALASRSPKRQELADILLGTIITGLRVAEWPSARFVCSQTPGFAWELIVRNAKYDEERIERARAHGEFRTLRWVGLDDEAVTAITRWIALANQAGQDGTYEKLIQALRDFMRKLTQDLFRRRRKRPTLYTGRHEAIARWKLHYVELQTTIEGRLQGLAIVAALSGHASDETATAHYGRPRRGERRVMGFPIPVADELEVARVRPRMHLTLARLAEQKSRREIHQP
jgi:hypothetical protein